MEQLELTAIETFKDQLQEAVKPYQHEQNRRHKKIDFLNKCIRCIDKNEFFQLDELLKSKQAQDVLEDSNFQTTGSIFAQMREYTETQIDNYRVKFRSALLELAKEAELPLEIDFPKFSVLKGIDGEIDFSSRSTLINQFKLKSIDPKRIIAAIVKLKQKLYDTVFEPQKFIDSLFLCSQKILNEIGGVNVPIQQLYTEYVWSLQNKTFFLNMDKGKFKGYSIEQFAVDLWRYFESDVKVTEGGYQLKFNPGRGKSLWLIDQNGEKRQITNVAFVKN